MNNEKKNLQDIQTWLEDWTYDMFPDYYDLSDPLKRDVMLARLLEEIGEVAKAMRIFNGRQYKNEVGSIEDVQEELGDSLVILLRLHSLYGLNAFDSIEMVQKKLERRRLNAKKQNNSDLQSSG